jgi:tRNA(Arg) A34 adenosine deaminase TadA
MGDTDMDVKLPFVPENIEILFVPENDRFMIAAKEFAREHATDRQMPTGSVIVKNGEIIGRGANQVPLKSPLFTRIHKDYLCVRRILGIPSGQKYWLCPGCASSKNHSEARAARDVVKNSKDATDADLYLWGHWWACEPCCVAAASVGIKRIFLMEESARLFNRDVKGNIVGRQFV